jgi:nicotinamide riboside kinase
MLRRINIFAGPGAGKSTVAAHLFSQLKAAGVKSEIVDEYVKSWAYEGRKIASYDQVYLFAEQLRREDRVLRHGDQVQVIVTDSPVIMSICYAMKYGFGPWVHLLAIALDFDKKYPSLNIFLDRGDMQYAQDGRYENYEQALMMDNAIKTFLEMHNIPFDKVGYRDWEKVVSLAKEKLRV